MTYQSAIDIIRQISPLTIAYYEYQQKDYISSLEDVNEIIENPSKDYDKFKIFNLKGLELQQLKKFNEAAYWFEQGLENDPNDFYLHLNTAYAYLNLKQFLKAEKQLEEAKNWINNDTEKSASFNNAMGAFYSYQKQYSRTIPFFKNACKLDSSQSDYLTNLGAAYANLRMYDSASYCLNLAYGNNLDALFNGNDISTGMFFSEKERNDNLSKASRAKNFIYGQYSLSLKLINSGRPNEAERYLLKCINIDSTFAPAYFQIGWIYNNYKNYDKANQMFDKANTFFPLNTTIYKGSINNYMDQGDYEQSINECYSILDQEPLNYDFYATLAKIYSLRNGTFQKAEYYYTLSLIINPNNINCLEEYCGFKKKSDYHSVITLSNTILSIEPSNIDAISNIAQANSFLAKDNRKH